MKKKLFYFSIIGCFLPLLMGIFYFSRLPQLLPSHWNAAGEIDGYMDKSFVLFGLPTLLLFVHLFVIWSMNHDPKHKNIPAIMYYLIYFTIPAISILVTFMSINCAIENGISFDVSFVLMVFVGLLLLFIGNYLPKCKQSYTVGIKTPWALDDEENWNKTHRIGGFLWSIGGIMTILSAFLPANLRIVVLFVTIMICAVIPYLYSYFIYQKKMKD